jgi:hypothetical protein
MVPRKPLQLVSCVITLNFVPGRTPGSALTSATASSIAGITALPITESNVNNAPMRSSAGLEPSPPVTFWPSAMARHPKMQTHTAREESWAEPISSMNQENPNGFLALWPQEADTNTVFSTTLICHAQSSSSENGKNEEQSSRLAAETSHLLP